MSRRSQATSLVFDLRARWWVTHLLPGTGLPDRVSAGFLEVVTPSATQSLHLVLDAMRFPLIWEVSHETTQLRSLLLLVSGNCCGLWVRHMSMIYPGTPFHTERTQTPLPLRSFCIPLPDGVASKPRAVLAEEH